MQAGTKVYNGCRRGARRLGGRALTLQQRESEVEPAQVIRPFFFRQHLLLGALMGDRLLQHMPSSALPGRVCMRSSPCMHRPPPEQTKTHARLMRGRPIFIQDADSAYRVIRIGTCQWQRHATLCLAVHRPLLTAQLPTVESVCTVWSWARGTICTHGHAKAATTDVPHCGRHRAEPSKPASSGSRCLHVAAAL